MHPRPEKQGVRGALAPGIRRGVVDVDRVDPDEHRAGAGEMGGEGLRGVEPGPHLLERGRIGAGFGRADLGLRYSRDKWWLDLFVRNVSDEKIKTSASNAFGAWVGGLTIAAGLGYTSPLWVGAAMAASALLVTLGADRLAAEARET